MSQKHFNQRVRFQNRAPKVRIVYRPKTEEEALRRCARAQSLLGTPVVFLAPAQANRKATAFVANDGTPVSVEAVEMVFNDALLMDAVSDWGKDGPLYRDDLDTELHREAYAYAVAAYAGVEIPEALKNPREAS
jgi:hypothetical protein